MTVDATPTVALVAGAVERVRAKLQAPPRRILVLTGAPPDKVCLRGQDLVIGPKMFRALWHELASAERAIPNPPTVAGVPVVVPR